MDWRTPDDRILSVTSDLVDGSRDWAYSCDRIMASGPSRFFVGSKGACLAELKDTWSPALSLSSFSYRDGTCRVAEFGEPGEGMQTSFIWEGPHHEMYTSVAGSSIDPQRFVDYLETLQIDDLPEGLVSNSVGRRRGAVSLRSAFMMIPDVGGVTIYPGDLMRQNLPKHRGRGVATGEMWAVLDSSTGVDLRALLIASASVAVLIAPNERSSSAGTFAESAVVALADSAK